MALYVRVQIVSTDEDCNRGGLDVVGINPDTNFAQLRRDLQTFFTNLQSQNAAAKLNLKGMAWGGADRLIKVKVVYKSGNAWEAGGDGIKETILTDTNYTTVMNMLKEVSTFDFWNPLH
jgi:hypothetical protein